MRAGKRIRPLLIVVGASLAVGVPLAIGGGGATVADKPGKSGSGDSNRGTLKHTKRTPLFAVLNGRNEVTNTGQRRAGDLDGEGAATVSVKGTTVCFGLTVQGIGTIQAAHIHKGKKGRNGPIVLSLPVTSGVSGDPYATGFCVPNDAAYSPSGGIDLKDLRKRPHRYYINVHTTDFPNGAVRGQLGRLPRREAHLFILR